MLANEAVSARIMASLCELGVSTSIDDFGTGYSSVILLKKLPLNELKLDRSFVASAVHSHQDREIVRSLILLAHSLQLRGRGGRCRGRGHAGLATGLRLRSGARVSDQQGSARRGVSGMGAGLRTRLLVGVTAVLRRSDPGRMFPPVE